MTNTLPQRIAANIGDLLHDSGMTQTQLAGYLNVTQGTVSRWIRGTRSISIEDLARVADTLGTTVGRICSQVEQPVTPGQHTVSPALPPQRRRTQKAAGPTSGPAQVSA